MFADSFKLTNMDVSIINTDKVTNMGFMFNICHSHEDNGKNKNAEERK